MRYRGLLCIISADRIGPNSEKPVGRLFPGEKNTEFCACNPRGVEVNEEVEYSSVSESVL